MTNHLTLFGVRLDSQRGNITRPVCFALTPTSLSVVLFAHIKMHSTKYCGGDSDDNVTGSLSCLLYLSVTWIGAYCSRILFENFKFCVFAIHEQTPTVTLEKGIL